MGEIHLIQPAPPVGRGGFTAASLPQFAFPPSQAEEGPASHIHVHRT